jgi:hypothetical protein
LVTQSAPEPALAVPQSEKLRKLFFFQPIDKQMATFSDASSNLRKRVVTSLRVSRWANVYHLLSFTPSTSSGDHGRGGSSFLFSPHSDVAFQ